MKHKRLVATTIMIVAFEIFIWGMSFLVLPGYEIEGGITLQLAILALVIVAILFGRLWDWVQGD